MAIKIIKHGEKIFKITCPICGCEFEYEYEDIDSHSVKCPDCGRLLEHSPYNENKGTVINPWQTNPCSPAEPIDPIIRPPHITWTTTTPGIWPDCETCPNKPDPTKTIIGDTPCTWCKKNQPYCFTGDKFPADYKGGVYTADYKGEGYTVNK